MRDESRTKVAILGAGLIAAQHLAAWRAHPEIVVSLVVDVDKMRAEAFAFKWDIPERDADLRAAVGHPDIGIVDICLPPSLHAEITIDCAKAGKNVLVEKPIATTLADGIRVAEAAAATGKTVMVAENWMFSSAARVAADVLRSGVIGRPFLLRGHHETTMYVDRTKDARSWVRDPITAGGGYLFDAGIHAISLIRQLLGDFATVTAQATPEAGPGVALFDEDVVLIGRLEAGALVALDLTGRARIAVPRRLAFCVFGDRGTLEFDIASGAVSWTADGVEQRADEAVSLGIAEEIAHFLRCIREGTEPLTSPRQQFGSLATVLAAYESIREGRAVRPAVLRGEVATRPARA